MLGATLGARDYLEQVCEVIRQVDTTQLEGLSDLIERAYHDGRFVFIIGNGGSGANASHLCEDLAKCTLRDFEDQKRLKVLSLTDNAAWLMAVANDLSYERVFVEQLQFVRLVAFLKRHFKLELPIEMVLDHRLVAAGHKDQVLDTGLASLVRHMLDQRPVDHRQHLFGHRFGRGKEPGAEAGNRENRFSYRLHDWV